MMKAVVVVVVVVVTVLVLFQSVCFGSTSLEETCKTEGAEHIEGVDYNFCITSLQMDPGSHKADTQGLAIIATNLLEANVTHNEALAKQLEASQNVSAEGKKALGDCASIYSYTANNAKEAIGLIRSGDSDGATTHLGASLTDIYKCLDAWKESKAQPLMGKENDDSYKLSGLALTVTALLN